ncbi:MAG TPA: glycoside hydrolase family 16 protein [Verrucomicrobiae bacterium]|nr:glycoside hydrolase family 16 protein [Verrucomicrobiae bacterium]
MIRPIRESLFRGVPMLAVFLFGAACSIINTHATPPAGYYLVWSDEFNSTVLDRTKWDYWLPGPRRNAVNVTNAILLDGSNLVITTYTSNKVHYTGFVATDETFRSRYGYWESRIRWGDTNGMWSAFWLQSPEMVTRAPDPKLSGSEIDIAEHRFLDKDEKNIANKIQVNIHWDGYGRNSHSAGSGNIGSNLANDFHTYGFLSTPDSYSFLIDDSKVYGGGRAPISHSTEWAILSSEVDDTSTLWAGHIPTNGYGGLGDSTTRMTVDYVRYYAPSNVLFWTGAVSGNWADTNNWIAGKMPLADSELTFTYLSANTKMVWDQSYAIKGIVVLQTKEDVFMGGADALQIGADGIDMSAANHRLEINGLVEPFAPQKWVVGQKAGVLKITHALADKEITKAGPGTLVLEDAEFSSRFNVEAGAFSTGDAIGTLTFSGLALSTNSTIALKVNGALRTSDQLKIGSPIIFSGNLKISNVAGECKAGDQFQLFEAENYSGAFDHITLPSLAPGLEWNTRTLTNGILSVVATTEL